MNEIEEEEMSQPARINVQLVYEKLSKGNSTLLVCAYSQEKFDASHLESAISLNELESKIPQLQMDAEIVFYWGWHGDASAVSLAAQYIEKGFQNVMVLDGGIQAWVESGYNVVTAT